MICHVAFSITIKCWVLHGATIIAVPIFNAIALEAHAAFFYHVRQIASTVARTLVFARFF
jgi:hypothetical protein